MKNADNKLYIKNLNSLYLHSPELITKTMQWLEKEHHYILFLEAPEHKDLYPKLLRQIHRPPEVLYLQGNIKILEEPSIAIVGSRHMSAYGKDNAWAFAKFLAESGLTITSGLALGIDAVAHESALNAGGYTIAVLPTGIDQCYPRSHDYLFKQISESGNGLLISEFPLGTPPLKTGFPRRNRIISGLSMGVLVVEAALKSGSLITARTAMEQGREVFAIPGSIHHALSKGCHQLIKSGAKCVESGSDILEECRAFLGPMTQLSHPLMTQLNLVEPHGTPGNFSSGPDLVQDLAQDLTGLAADPDYQNLLRAINFKTLSRIDDLIQSTQLPARDIASMLLMLELDGWIEQVSGGYMRIRE